MIDRGSLRHARLDSGCFRLYLRAAARHLAANEPARALPGRGGRALLGPFVEDRPRKGVERDRCRAGDARPVRQGDARSSRAWTEARDAVLGRARDEADRFRLAALLRHVDSRGDDDGRRLSAELSTSEGAARVALHRLRRRVAARLAAH
ncbi:MAG: hypothetical protein U0599_15285 [Vicinamibacteria bacterium]